MARGKRKGRPVHGILLLNKPIGISSNRALQKAKHLFNAQKAGHTGSLDPLATGMLPICFGEATKISAFLLDSDKQYRTTAQLGITTNTGDAEGEVLQQCAIDVFTAESIEAVLGKFRGSITQIPPMYSALKHQGKPLYELARQGIEIERNSREVTIYKLELIGFTADTLELTVKCSKGTYIRTLVEDIGNALGCGAHVSMLHRDYVEPFTSKGMVEWEELEGLSEQEREDLLLPGDAALTGFPKANLDAEQSQRLLHGQTIDMELPEIGLYRIYNDSEEFLGVGSVEIRNQLKPKRIMQQSE